MSAVRSDNLKGERWDLISWAAVDWLKDEFSLSCVSGDPIEQLNSSVKELGQYLGNVAPGSMTRFDKLLSGWVNLAAAIENLYGDSGAVLRSLGTLGGLDDPKVLRYYPYKALRLLAETCHEGAIKYGQYNWLYGFPTSNTMNHGIKHIVQFTNGDRSENHLGHAMWNCMATVHNHIFRPDLCTLMLGSNYTLTDEIKAAHTHKRRESISGI